MTTLANAIPLVLSDANSDITNYILAYIPGWSNNGLLSAVVKGGVTFTGILLLGCAMLKASTLAHRCWVESPYARLFQFVRNAQERVRAARTK